ncbi:MAG: hypothetical protein AAFY71_12755 [Bacteroidota bacterium]
MTDLLSGIDLDTLFYILEKPDTKWAWYGGLFLLAFVKFLLAALAALGDPSLTFWEFFLSVGGGAMLSVVFYTYFGEFVRKWAMKTFFPSREKNQEIKETEEDDKGKGSKHVREIWRRYGLPGVAFLAPFLSPMVCVGVAVSFNEDPRRIIFFNVLSIVVWTILFGVLRSPVIEMATNIGLLK